MDKGNANVGYVHIQGGQLPAGKTNIGDFCTVRKKGRGDGPWQSIANRYVSVEKEREERERDSRGFHKRA